MDKQICFYYYDEFVNQGLGVCIARETLDGTSN